MKSYLDELISKKMIQTGVPGKEGKIVITKSGVEFNLKYLQMKDLERTFGL